jgi:hypothetical protein
MKNIKFFEDFGSSTNEIQEGHEGREMKNYMFFQNLHTLKSSIEELLEMDPNEIDGILSDGHGWALDHIATSVDDVEEVYHFLSGALEMGHNNPHDDDDDDDDDDENEEDETPIQVDLEGSNDNVEIETGEEDE